MSIIINKLTLSIGTKKICNALDLEVKPGEFWAILGVNGVGKSTLLHHMINVNNTFVSEISIDNEPLLYFKKQRKKLAKKVGILLQDYEYNFPCTVLDATLIGRHPYLSEWQWESKEDLEIAEQSLTKTHLISFKDRLTNTLSGGEKRRLNIATLLSQDPDYLLLDEPTNHLDLGSQIMMLDLLKQHIKENNKSGIMVIHDANLAYRYCDKVLMLFGDGDWSTGPIDKLINTKNLERLYHCTFNKISDDIQSIFIAG